MFKPQWRLAPWCVLALALGAANVPPARAQTATPTPAKTAEETVRIPGPVQGLKLGLRHAWSASDSGAGRSVVLLLPGAAVPVSGNPDYPFTPGRSLLTALAETGLDIWAMDYYGYGNSDRYPQMQQPANNDILGTAADCAAQTEAAVAFIRQKRRVERVMLIGDSAGSMVAGVFATRHPDLISRLILFGPVTPFTDGPTSKRAPAAYALLTPKDLWDQFTTWSQAAGEPAVLDAAAYEAWAQDYLRSDPTSRTRTPPSVRMPNGFQVDLAGIASGKFVYDPSEIKAPTLIIMGESDQIATFPGAQWLLRALRQAPSRQLVIIGRGSHTIQFESERPQLYQAMAEFLNRGK
jgi:pimeloyl-ACP methyl ester carboxylesterase